MSTTAGLIGPYINKDFPIQKQLMRDWCWAAVSVSLCNYYRGTNIAQPPFVASVLGMPICANQPLPPCNRVCDFGFALNKTGFLKGSAVNNPLPPENVMYALQHTGVIGCDINIPGIGGHAVAIVGAQQNDDGSFFVRVADPSDGSLQVMPFAQFRNNYRGTSGYWQSSYYTGNSNY